MKPSAKTLALLIAALGSGSSAAAPVIAKSFAIKCQTAPELILIRGGTETREESDGYEHIFVIDPTQNLAFRALDADQEYEPICKPAGGQGKAQISPTAIIVSSYEVRDGGFRAECQVSIDRTAGTGSYMYSMGYSDEDRVGTRWDMTCKPAPVPVFEPYGAGY